MEDETIESGNFSFPNMEMNILKFWNDQKIFEKSLDKNRNKNNPFIFYDGPPFATGLPHHGHIVGSILKDIIPRYYTMKGFHVDRRFGWDCHGLPIETEIDKKMGMSAQDAVAKLGVKGYNDECRAIVSRYTFEWRKTISRIGRWVDFDNDYKTMDLSFMESVWWVFKELWNKGLIYQGTKVVPYSSALGTVLSNFEANLNYQDVQDPAITVLFKIKNSDRFPNTYLMAWTTTPWTLPSNLALCAGAKISYVRALDNDKNIHIIVARDRFESYAKKRNLTIVEELLGSDLLGLKYDPLFSYFKDLESEGAFVVLNDDYVSASDGTGIVHTAPAFGEDDNRIMKMAKIKAIVCPIDVSGKFTSDVSDFKGQFVKDADKEIIKKLKDQGSLYEQSVLVHSYPFCWRTDTPLIYRAIPSWYVEVEKIKKDMILANEEINWIPDNIKHGRFGKWLENAKDWAISRNRVWGTPLPIWINDETDERICMGSVEELKKYTGVHVTDLHRESVDNLTFKMDGKPGVFKRIPEVLDCWFESGSMPYAQLHYPFENKEVFEKGFPAQYIAEGLDQTRGWFYTLNVLSSALFKKPAFKNVIVNGIVLAEDGKKMSKRLKNYTPPDELMENFGADALRLYLINSGLVKAEDQRFSDNGVKDMVRRALLPWYNAYKFFATYAGVDGYSIKDHYVKGQSIMDQWIVSKLQTLKKNIEFEMEGYRLYNVVPQLFNFIDDLTNWYIRLNRARYWANGLEQDKKEAYSTLYLVLKELSLVMAPFTPFMSEYLYSEFKKLDLNLLESVHLEDYPRFQEELMNPTLEDAVKRMQEVILMGRQKRNQVQIKVKMPLKKLTLIHRDAAALKEMSVLESLIKTELNIKEIHYDTNECAYISLYVKPNLPVLGKRLGKEFSKFAGLFSKLTEEEILKLEEKGEIVLGEEKFSLSDFLIFREAKKESDALSNRFISIQLDTELNDDLISEGLAREMISCIQKTRKNLRFNVEDRIEISINFNGDETLKKVLKTHEKNIMSETLSVKIKHEANLNDQGEIATFDVDGHPLALVLRKSTDLA